MKKRTWAVLLLASAIVVLPALTLAGGSFFIDDTTSFVGIGNTTPVARLDVSGTMYSRLVSASSTAIDWNAGNVQSLTLTSSPTLTFSNPHAGAEYKLIVNQDATGGRTVTWPGSVKWANNITPTLSTAANSIDMVSIVYSGSDYLGVFYPSFGTTPTGSITYDNYGHTSGSGTSCSFNLTVGSGSNSVVIVNIQNRSTSDPASSVTVGGVSATLVAANNTTTYGTEMWVATGVSSGSKNVAVTMVNSGGGFNCAAASYFGVNQSTPIDSFATSSVAGGNSPLNASTSVGVSDAWLVMTTNGDFVLSAGSDTTQRISTELYDSNGPVGTGSQQLQVTWGGTGDENAVIASLKPF